MWTPLLLGCAGEAPPTGPAEVLSHTATGPPADPGPAVDAGRGPPGLPGAPPAVLPPPPLPGTSVDAMAEAGGVRAIWQPGDPIPGWPDGEPCGEPTATDTFQLSNPTLWSFEGTITRAGGVVGMVSARLVTRDCVNFACDTTAPFDPSDPFVDLRLRTLSPPQKGAGLLPWGVGAWGPAQEGGRTLEFDAETLFGRVRNIQAGPRANVDAAICLDRVRPDEVRGSYRFDLERGRSPVPVWQYRKLTIWAPFVVRFDGAGGEELPGSAAPLEDGRSHRVWRYVGVSYSDAWPWDQITDPAVRASVYALYEPGP